MDKNTVKWIETVLSNDEVSTDEELIQYFMDEGKFNRKDAEEIVKSRGWYLGVL